MPYYLSSIGTASPSLWIPRHISNRNNSNIMSTIDSLSLVSAITFGRDILWRIEKNSSKEDLSHT